MAFRYLNPGYAELFSDSGDCLTVKNAAYNPNNGVSIKSPDVSFVEILPAGYFSTNFFCKFDLYVDGNPYYGDNFVIGLARYNYSDNVTQVTGMCTYNGYAYIYNYSSRRIATGTTLKSNSLNSIAFSVDIQEATASLTLNGETITYDGLSNMGYVGAKSPFKVQLKTSSRCTYYLSNVIISDTEISPKEQIIALPTLATETNMTAGTSGMYIANAANQTLLQSVDVSTLIENYGASSAVTGIALVGNPAYKTATGLASMIGITKSGGASIAEHGNCDLSDDTSATIFDGWAVDNLTIADLQGMQFGWKAGE